MTKWWQRHQGQGLGPKGSKASRAKLGGPEPAEGRGGGLQGQTLSSPRSSLPPSLGLRVQEKEAPTVGVGGLPCSFWIRVPGLRKLIKLRTYGMSAPVTLFVKKQIPVRRTEHRVFPG